ncbi:MAG: HDOD domain-containing protein [Mariprofundaceae bacterium]|nr:HDOD domain-containing protein [Mariprofundaceae bacterium]
MSDTPEDALLDEAADLLIPEYHSDEDDAPLADETQDSPAAQEAADSPTLAEQTPDKSAQTPKPDADTEAQVDDDDNEPAEIPEQSLRWCFEILSPAAPDTPPYDLCSPPPIEAERLAHLKRAIADIPPLPEIWHKVRRMVESDEASPRELARLVEQDPVLTSHVLQWGNSAVYAASDEHVSSDVGVTLTRMGMDEAQNLILESLMPQLGDVGEKSGIEAQHIWFHSKAMSMFARKLSTYSALIDDSHAGLFGLLHDIGKLVILHVESAEALQDIATRIAADAADLQAEYEVLGYTHIDAGMMLALHWRLPREVHRFIYFHHHAGWHRLKSWPGDMHDAVMLIHAAHMLLRGMQGTAPAGGAWAGALRCRMDEGEDVLRHRLHIPLTDTALYIHLEKDLERLKRLFPEIYPPQGD